MVTCFTLVNGWMVVVKLNGLEVERTFYSNINWNRPDTFVGNTAQHYWRPEPLPVRFF